MVDNFAEKANKCPLNWNIVCVQLGVQVAFIVQSSKSSVLNMNTCVYLLLPSAVDYSYSEIVPSEYIIYTPQQQTSTK